ncbi:MAG: ornithine cyclodeaminase family protein [Clostridia bacterium]
MRYLSGSLIREHITVGDLVPVVDDGLRAIHASGSSHPLRLTLPVGERGTVLLMPAYLAPLSALAAKYVAVFPGNAASGRPTTPGVLVYADADTGEPLALMDGGVVTQLRTGAVVTLATDRLARRNASHLAIIGAGVQALGISEGIMQMRPIKHLRVYARNPAHRQRFLSALQTRLAQIGVPCPADLSAAPTPEAAVEGMDIVVLATTSRTPVVRPDAISADAHVNGVGAFQPDMVEIPPGLFARAARVVVESREAALHEAGDLMEAARAGHVQEDRLEVLAECRPDGWEGGLSIFKSVGVAALDAAVARFLHQRLERAGLELPE